jgi:menaquinone-dependent protoporphyrinogen oxidase
VGDVWLFEGELKKQGRCKIMKKGPILLAYATRYGSTREAAETIASVLREAGLEVDMQPMKEVKTLDSYAAVVLGAAIYNSRWHPDAHHFLVQHQEVLRQVPVAIFTLGPLSTGSEAMQKSRLQLDRELEKAPWLKPIALEVFVGKFDRAKKGSAAKPSPDHRDWDAIRAWARSLPAQLLKDVLPSLGRKPISELVHLETWDEKESAD